MGGVWVVVPAYNEASVIAETLAGIVPRYPVVVVDDGSSDATIERARAAGASIVAHPINLGQGAALATGITYALRRGADFVATFDADGQHDPASIGAMHELLEATGADAALGSRFLGSTVGMSASRRVLLKAAILFTRFHTKLPVTDTHNGLRMFRRSLAERLRIRQRRMAHASEILSELARLEANVVEVPTTITYSDYSRRKGQRFFDSIKVLVDLAYESLTV